MTQANPQQLAFGKTDTTKLYATIKNGNIYSLRAAVRAEAGPALIAKIQAAGKIDLKHWAKVTRTVKPKPAKAKAPRPEYKEVVVANQAARIRELQAEVKELRAHLVGAPHDEALEEMEIQASIDRYAVSLANKMHKRSAAAKKGWATRRANAQQVAS